MASYLARIGVAVFSLAMAFALVTEHLAAGRALVAGAATSDLPSLREIAPIAVVEAPAAPAAAVAPATPASAPVPLDAALVLASWYGPGFYGNHTACGHVYTPEILGVAHLTLPCGTSLTLTYGSRSIVVPVVDRGPYIDGRTLDLSNATKIALACTDLCTVRMQIRH